MTEEDGVARYDYGGDRYVFVEFAIDMALEENFKTLSLAEAIEQADIEGIVEVIPSICSMLVEYDRTVIQADPLIEKLKAIEASMTHLTEIPTRIIDFPALFADPWTTECAETFKSHQQNGQVPNIDFVAEINGFSDRESFIDALCATPYWTVMVGFTPGLPWLYPMGVSGKDVIQAPKYNRPRTWTPSRAVGLGGAFLAIYSVRNPGGYQLLMRTTNPIYDPKQEHPDFMENPVLLKPGDILKWRSVNRDAYDRIWEGIQKGQAFKIKKVTFEPEAYLEEPARYTQALMEGF
ncbi:MAG: carboxyltransferase domain-containing protein [Candidatus Thermoplasmatota archaeon]|nr:carboxyltransferase domain-containing protein [Candidatus Thermoplasmatota archaeon]